MELKLIDKNGKAAKGGITVSEVTFGREFNEALVHQVVVAYMANARTATRAQCQPYYAQAMEPEGYRPCAFRYELQPDLAWRWSRIPE